MKKFGIFLLMTLPMVSMPTVSMAQSTLTPQEQLEQAQKQLEEAQKALEQAKANAARAQQEAKAREEAAAKAKAEAEAKAKAEAEAKAKADAEATAKAAEIQKQIEAMKKETARLQQEAEKAKAIQPTTEEAKVVEQPKVVEEPAQEAPTEIIEEPKAESKSEEENKPVIIEDNAPVPEAPKKETKKNEENEIQTRLAPVDDDDDNEKDQSVYLAANAVPVVNGKVVWSATIKAPGQTADELYKKTEEYLTSLTSDKLQLEGSQLALKKPAKHNLTATVHEWLIFRNNALSLDRTEIFYVLNTFCYDGEVKITMSRIHYKYDVMGKIDNYTAEDWITDKNAVNKKRTRLYPISGKFRKKTIDRKNEIFQTLAKALQ